MAGYLTVLFGQILEKNFLLNMIYILLISRGMENPSIHNNIKFLDEYISNINDDCVIVGWSYGGNIAKKCMESNNFIKKIILINSFCLNKTSFISTRA